MILNKEDSELFFKLWIPLLDFVNTEYQVCTDFKMQPYTHEHYEQSPPDKIKKISDYLWEHKNIIDEYLEKSKLPAEHQNIISEWKKAVTDVFIVERHLKKGSILISTQNEVYQVCGITLSFEEILNMPLPVLLKTTLIPFKGVIIYDGLANVSSAIFGSGYKSFFKDLYMTAKQNKKIHQTMSEQENLTTTTQKPQKAKIQSDNKNHLSYVIRVTLSKNCYRDIRISANATLNNLAGQIIDAFDFYFEHLYSFFMDNRWWSEAAEYTSPFSRNPPYANKVKLSKFSLRKSQQFKFLYDYGDEWRFQCKVLEVLEEETKKATVVFSRGEAPEQYPDYDE
ncbi:MAG: hypothetical protein J6A58_11015 [Oscillospiraceae bacterium]|nr:hypothetical protein [Oscillospiraceae bacterium]